MSITVETGAVKTETTWPLVPEELVVVAIEILYNNPPLPVQIFFGELQPPMFPLPLWYSSTQGFLWSQG